MKKLSIALVCLVMLAMTAIPVANAEMQLIDLSIIQNVGKNSSEWMEHSQLRSLLVAAVNICLEDEGAWDSWFSSPNLDGAYVGKDGTRMAVVIPTQDQKHSIVVVFTPTDAFGMYDMYNGDFGDYNVKKGISSMCTLYEKVNAEDNKYIAELLDR